MTGLSKTHLPLFELSKSTYLLGQQCPLRLWLHVHGLPDGTPRPSDPDRGRDLRFAVGHRVGEFARRCWPTGVLIEATYRESARALRDTEAALARAPRVPLFEPAFVHRGVFVRVDALIPERDGSWTLVEVKSTKQPKPLHIEDAALQAWVLRGAGLDISRVAVMTLDADYVRPAGADDNAPSDVLRLHDVTRAAAEHDAAFEDEVTRLLAVRRSPEPPSIAPGPQCASPYECDFAEHCGEAPAQPRAPRRVNGRELGDSEYVGEELADALEELRYPLYHLDFEAAGMGLPAYAGFACYEPAPFLFSCHVEQQDGSLEHVEYLHPDRSCPDARLADALLEALGDEGTILSYSAYEATTIRRLARRLPHLAPQLEALLERITDLLSIVRTHYYHPAFERSFSIKKVLPALAPSMGYADLDVRDGRMASVLYEAWHAYPELGVTDAEIDGLRAYCARDTEAMVAVLGVLRERAGRAQR